MDALYTKCEKKTHFRFIPSLQRSKATDAISHLIRRLLTALGARGATQVSPHSALLAMTDVILLNCNVEVVVYGFGQITKQRIYIVPNIIDRVIGIN